MQNYFQRLELALVSRGKSKGDLAGHLHVALSTVSRWKRAAPRASTIQDTADYLGVDAKWLFTGQGSPPSVPGRVHSVKTVTEVKHLTHAEHEKKDNDLSGRVAQLEIQVRIISAALSSILPSDLNNLDDQGQK